MSDVRVAIENNQIAVVVDPIRVGVSVVGQRGPAGPIGGANTQVLFNDGGDAAGGDARFVWNKVTGQLALGSTATVGWSDLLLQRDAANTLALRNGASSQVLRVYATDDGAGNFERGFVGWTGSVFQIGTEKGGTGTGRAIRILTDGTNRWQVAGNGHISAVTSNTYDILGARTVRAETSLEVSTNGLRLSWTAGTGGTVQTTGQPLLLNPSGNRVVVGGGSFAELSFTSSANAPILNYSGVGNALELKNGTNPQILRVYETWTDAANYSRGYIQAAVGLFQIRTEATGTGIARNIAIRPGGNAVLFGFGISGATQYTFSGSESGNAQLTMRPSGSDALYSIIEMQGQNGVGAAGMLLQAGQNAGWIGADTITLRKRDNSVNYLVLNSTAATFGVPISGPTNVLEMRNGTSLQTLRIYGSYTDGSNYERLGIYRHATWGWTLENQAAGTGGNRSVSLSGFRVHFVVGGAAVWRVESDGNFRPEANNTIDIGVAGSMPRSIYAGTSVVAPGLTTTPVLVSALPSAHPSRDGMRAYVTDSTLPYTAANIGTVVTGGGANKVPVMFVNGTGWIIG